MSISVFGPTQRSSALTSELWESFRANQALGLKPEKIGEAIIYKTMLRSECARRVPAESLFAELEDMLDDSFLDDESWECLLTRVHGVRDALFCVTNGLKDKADFLENGRKYLTDYLDRYMELLHQSLASWEALQQSLEYKTFFQRITNLGCVYYQEPQGSRVGEITPLAPPYVAALLEMAQQFDNFANMEEQFPDADSSDCDGNTCDQTLTIRYQVTEIYREVLFTHLYRYMRWFAISPKGTLCHIALRSCPREPFEEESLNLPIVPLDEYSSYEGIGELRLLEKIHYELERPQRILPGEQERTVFRILITGDLNMGQFVWVSRALSGWMNDKKDRIHWVPSPDKLKIHFTLLTRTPADDTDWDRLVHQNERIAFEIMDYAKFFGRRREFQSLVKTFDLLFFLDCKELYNSLDVEPYEDLRTFLQWPRPEKYTDLHCRLEKANASFLPENKFFRMRELLVGAAYSGSPGFFEKEVNRSFLQLLENCLKEEGQFVRTAYVYYSDIYAAEPLRSSDYQFVRIERHAGKKFAILRLGFRDDNKLKNAAGDKDRKIVFNLWQFIKHIALHKAEALLRYFQPNKCDFKYLYLLSDVLVAIDYHEWPRQLALSYHFQDKEVSKPAEFERKLRAFLEHAVKPCFFTTEVHNPLYQKYFCECIASFLYSDAKYVDDMLFLDVFSCHFDRLQKVQIKTRDEKLQNPRLSRMKYSDKHVYQKSEAKRS